MQRDAIVIRGAKEHNLKNINLELLRNKLIVVTSLSDPDKSSFTFDTIYAEGQRRYGESLTKMTHLSIKFCSFKENLI